MQQKKIENNSQISNFFVERTAQTFEPDSIETENFLYCNEISQTANIDIDSNNLILSKLNKEQSNLVTSNDLNTTDYIGKMIREHAIKFNLNRTSVSSLLKGLKKIYPLLPSDYRSLLKTPRKTIVKIISGGEYVHFSLINTFKLVCKNMTQNKELEVSFFVDGVAFFSDCCKKSFWVVLCRYDGKIYPVGIFNGSNQPKSFNELLIDVVNDIKELSAGFWVEDKFFTLKVKNFCADSPAKAHITYTAHTNAYRSCPYCYIDGYFDKRMIFDTTGHQKRTNDEFINQLDSKHHRGKSILETELNLNMIDQFPGDVLHIVYLGVFKKQLRLMSDPEKRQLPKICGNEISTRLLFCNHFMVSEIHRKFRPLNNVASFHGNECRSILLKFGIVVFKGAIPAVYYKNYLMLHVAISILCDKDLCIIENEAAEHILKAFIENSVNIYGNVLATFNLHMLEHLAEIVKIQNSPLESFSTFQFENFLYSIRRTINKKQYPLQQVHRRIVEEFQYDIEKKMTQENKIDVRYVERKGKYESVHIDYKKFSTFGCRDRFILDKLLNVYVCMIIEKDKGNFPVFLCRRLKNIKSFFKTPIDSSLLDIYECDTAYDSLTLKKIEYSHVKFKLQGIPYSETSMVFVPIKDFYLDSD